MKFRNVPRVRHKWRSQNMNPPGVVGPQYMSLTSLGEAEGALFYLVWLSSSLSRVKAVARAPGTVRGGNRNWITTRPPLTQLFKEGQFTHIVDIARGQRTQPRRRRPMDLVPMVSGARRRKEGLLPESRCERRAADLLCGSSRCPKPVIPCRRPARRQGHQRWTAITESLPGPCS